jgi:hypothetical protein
MKKKGDGRPAFAKAPAGKAGLRQTDRMTAKLHERMTFY